MKYRFPVVVGIGLIAVAVAGCEASKSSNPLSPTVAGPIPGVNITAPKPLEPAANATLDTATQPITLLLENASTSGVRPLNYLFEIATDAAFTTKVFSLDGVTAGTNGRTSVKLVDLLSPERTYYWRARAQDGANTGPYSSGVNFQIVTPIVLQPPTPLSPVDGAVTANTNPTFTFRNAARTGPVGNVSYAVQVSTNESFSDVVGQFEVGEQSSQTSRGLGSDLKTGTRYFWRVRAAESFRNIVSLWSVMAWFKTPSPAAPPPTPTPNPNPGGGSCALGNGPAIIACISAKYADRRAPVGSLGERQTNMAFLRDRVIEAGKCSGLDYGWNLKRGGPELSIDVIAWKRPDGNMGVDIGYDYDNISKTLQLVWSEVDLNASYAPYPAVSCGGV